MKSLEPALHSLSDTTAASPALGFDINFLDLYRRDGLLKLDQAFLDFLQDGDPELRTRFRPAGVFSAHAA